MAKMGGVDILNISFGQLDPIGAMCYSAIWIR